jgi:hypothetical protein
MEMRSAILLPATLAAFVLAENLCFNTGWYAKIASPESAAGHLELSLWNEHKRPRSDRPEVLAIGDSRMGFFPRYADQMPDLRYKFATIATPGTTERDWYYMLRDADPDANRYSAIVIPMYDYDDEEGWENLADRETDLHYLIARLRWSDLLEFAGSYDDPTLKFRAALGILLKGTVYKADFQDLLTNRAERLKSADESRRGSADWSYNFEGATNNVSGVKIDWSAKTVEAPPGMPESERDQFQGLLFAARPTYSGRRSAYVKKWLGKICEHYRGSATRLFFFRLPRGPFVRPDPPPFNPRSSVRELAKRPHVILDDEHDFDFLEKPELFMDHAHLNAAGCAEFSRALARRVEELLGSHAF